MDIIKIYYDLETTGLDFRKNGIHQIAGIIEVNDVEVDNFNFLVQPNPKAQINPKALELCGVTLEQVQNYAPMKEVHRRLTETLARYVNRFDRKQKAHLVGFNNRKFDDNFLRAWFSQCGDKYFGSWFWPNTIDVMGLASEYLIYARPDMKNFKLKTLAKHFGIPVEPEKLHTGDYDVLLTRRIYEIVTDRDLI